MSLANDMKSKEDSFLKRTNKTSKKIFESTSSLHQTSSDKRWSINPSRDSKQQIPQKLFRSRSRNGKNNYAGRRGALFIRRDDPITATDELDPTSNMGKSVVSQFFNFIREIE